MHDWLSTKHFLGRLARWQRLLEGQIDAPGSDADEFDRMVKEWSTHEPEMRGLIADCIVDMSPRVLLNRRPLSALAEDQREWIGAIVHQMWLRRFRIHEKSAEASEAVTLASAEFAKVSTLASAIPPDSGRRVYTADVTQLIAAARRVHSALDQLPSRVRVT